MKYLAVDYRINNDSILKLQELGYTVIKTIPIKNLYEAVNGHPDMQLHYFRESNELLCAAEAYDYYKEILPKTFKIICSSKELNDKYPNDILFNTANIGKYAICSKKNTAVEILERYSNIIDVKQGYAKCSIAIVSDNAAITSDDGICKALRNHGIEVLKIEHGHIKLRTMSYGFIGGCCGLIEKDLLAFNGRLDLHPQNKDIREFCKKFGVNVLCLNNDELYDVGSIIGLY